MKVVQSPLGEVTFIWLRIDAKLDQVYGRNEQRVATTQTDT